MSGAIPTRQEGVVPTVPTTREAVGTGQPIGNIHCSDRSECSDHPHRNRVEKRGLLGGLVERLRQQKGGSSTFEYRHELSNDLHTSNSHHPMAQPVGTVGSVGTANEDNGLSPVTRSEHRSEQSEQPPAAAEAPFRADEPPPPSSDDYQEMTEADWLALCGPLPDDQAHIPAATLPHVEAPAPPAANDTVLSDPWAAGIARLQRMPPLDGFSVDGWKLVRRGCTTLLRTHGDVMRRFGWSAEDAFGIHPDAPGGAVHCYGLGVLLKAGRVIELTAAGATIEAADGRRQSFVRRPNPAAVPIWTVHPTPSAPITDPEPSL